MADNQPIKYSDLISPDDSLEKLVKQLDEISSALQLVQKSAVTLGDSMKTMSGATSEGRSKIADASKEAEKLAKAQQELAYAQSETAKKIAELNLLKQKQNQANKEEAKILLSQRGSYDRLSARYSQLKRELNSMNPVTEKARRAFDAKQKAANKLMEQMNELQKATGKYTLQVGNYELAGKSLRKELREITLQLQQMRLRGEENSEEYQKLLERAGELNDTMGDVSQAINKTASDTSNLDAVLGAASAATGGFAVATAGMSMLGASTNDVAQAQKKLQEAIALVNGVQAIANALNRDSALMVKMLAIQSAAAAKAKSLETKETIGATIAQKAFNLVAKANPYILLITAITSVVGVLVLFSRKTAEAEKKLKSVQQQIERNKIAMDALQASASYASSIISKLGGDEVVAYDRNFMSMWTNMEKLKDALKGTEAEIDKIRNKNIVSQEDVDKMRDLTNQAKETKNQINLLDTQMKQLVADMPILRKQIQSNIVLSKELNKNKSVENSLTNQVNLLRKKAELFSQQNYGAKNYDIEEKIYNLEVKRINNQIKNAEIREKSIEKDYNIAVELINSQIALTAEEKKSLIEKKNIEKEDKLTEISLEKQNAQYALSELSLDRQISKIQQKTKEIETQRELQKAGENRLDEQAESITQLSDAELDLQKARLEGTNTFNNKVQLANLEFKKNLLQIERSKNTELLALQREERDKRIEIEENGNLTTEQKTSALNAIKEHYQSIALRKQKVYDTMTEAEQLRHNNEMNELTKDATWIEKLFGDIPTEGFSATNSALQTAIANVNSYVDSLVQLKKQAVDTANAQVNSAQKVLDAEIEARNAGYANNVETAQKELQLAKKRQKEAEQEAKKAQQEQQRLDSLQQASSLVTASAELWKSLGGIPTVGPALAMSAIATMWGSFAASKIKAIQMTKEKYGEGTVELLQGGSHQSGNDIDLGTKANGVRRRAEGGEFFAVINKRNSRKYRHVIPDVIKSLNNDTFTQRYLSASERMSGNLININATSSTDIRQLQDDVRTIKTNLGRQTYVDQRGNLVEKMNGYTRITRR